MKPSGAQRGNRNAAHRLALLCRETRCVCGEHCTMLARPTRRGLEVNCPTCGRWRLVPATTGQR